MATLGKKLVKSKSGYRMVTVDDNIASPFTIEEPQWIPDSACSHCQNIECQAKFDILKRKHHCRRCGKCFCASCSSYQVALPRMCFIDPVRHCKACSVVTKRENEFFDTYLPTLLLSAEFRRHTDDTNDNDNDNSQILPGKTFKCTLSSDHRFLQFEGDTEGQENIAIDKIVSVQVAGAEVDQQGNRVGKGIAIRYINSVGNSVMLKMDVEDSSATKQQSMSWVIAMLKAFKLVHESRSNSPSP